MNAPNISDDSQTLTFSGGDALLVLASSDFTTTRHVAFLEDLAERLKLDFTATLAVMKHLPLWANGYDHQLLRQEAATLVGKHRRKKLAQAEIDIQHTFRRHMIEAADVIDMLGLVRELVADLMAQISGLTRPSASPWPGLNIFSSNLGIAARLRLEVQLKDQLRQASDLYPDESERHHAIRVGQWAMGYDALVGTIGQSVYHHLRQIGTSPLTSSPMAESPTATGVPMIGRIATRDIFVSGCPVPRGSLVECQLDGQTGTHRHLGFFGAGLHLCLGRPHALEFFRMTSRQFNACDFGLEILSYRKQDCDVFAMPAEFLVRKTNIK